VACDAVVRRVVAGKSPDAQWLVAPLIQRYNRIRLRAQQIRLRRKQPAQNLPSRESRHHRPYGRHIRQDAVTQRK
jgi:hypothetical protein